MQACFEGDHWPIFWTSLILLAAVIAFPIVTAWLNWRERNCRRSSDLAQVVIAVTTEEFIGRTAWIANSLLITVRYYLQSNTCKFLTIL